MGNLVKLEKVQQNVFIIYTTLKQNLISLFTSLRHYIKEDHFLHFIMITCSYRNFSVILFCYSHKIQDKGPLNIQL